VKLRAGGRRLEIEPQRPLVMGIVNVGEDSVADPLQLRTLAEQLEHAHGQLRGGASVVDVGALSGRTDTPAITEDREIEMLVPLVAALAEEGVTVSVDTWRPKVAAATIEAGAAIVNDVSGLLDERMAEVAADTGAGLVLMHTKAPPKVARFPAYENPLADVRSRLEELVGRAKALGVAEEQLILDPGLDYAKTPAESIAVLRRLHELAELRRPLLLAVSRKYFLGMLRGRLPEERLPSTLAAIGFGVDAGASILRVHDVAEVVDYLAVRKTLAGDGVVELAGDPEAESLKWLPPKGAAGA
jgi:dihydropteroate synthase